MPFTDTHRIILLVEWQLWWRCHPWMSCRDQMTVLLKGQKGLKWPAKTGEKRGSRCSPFFSSSRECFCSTNEVNDEETSFIYSWDFRLLRISRRSLNLFLWQQHHENIGKNILHRMIQGWHNSSGNVRTCHELKLCCFSECFTTFSPVILSVFCESTKSAWKGLLSRSAAEGVARLFSNFSGTVSLGLTQV